MTIRFPAPLRPGDLIAVTAPSSGVPAALHPRLDLVIAHLRAQGYRVVEGECLRANTKDASAPRHARARELTGFLSDPAVAAVMPPWGGELACELLDLIDFDALASMPPKWFVGFSDLSTLHLPLTLVAGWATAHGANLMDLAPTQTEPLLRAVMDVLGADFVQPVRQASSALWQRTFIDFAVQADAALNLTEPTRWRRLDGSDAPIAFGGHLIGGCLDTIAWLAGTRHGDVPGFVERNGRAGTILYLENCDFAPPDVVRAFSSLRRHGWFDGLAGMMIGRSSGPEPASPDALSQREALSAVLDDLPCPVLCDVDIGHRPPQLTLVNGAYAEVRFDAGRGALSQTRLPMPPASRAN